MDFNTKPTLSEAHPETMDFLSKTWCNFAVQTFQPGSLDRSIVLHESSIGKMDLETNSLFHKMEKSVKMEDSSRSIPSWKSNDVKSWIWMQQAMHPELNYNSCFTKKWFPNVSIKKWIKEIKQKRKEGKRLHRAEVHAALSVAGVAAALAAIAASKNDMAEEQGAAVASAAALVAAQCAQIAEAMGAKKEQLKSVISSAISGANNGDILTLTAAAASSLRGASTLKARTGCKNRLNGNCPVLPIDHEENTDFEFDFKKCRSILAKGAQVNIEMSDGRCMVRSVSITLSDEAKVILRTKKRNLLNIFGSTRESIILDIHVELYKDRDADETDTCYLIALTTNNGVIKIDMMDDYQRYKAWATTINHMLMLSTSFTKYELQFYNN